MSTVGEEESERPTRVWYLIAALSVGGAERRLIDALLADPDRAVELGEAARESAHRRFTTGRLVADVEALYAEVAADG